MKSMLLLCGAIVSATACNMHAGTPVEVKNAATLLVTKGLLNQQKSEFCELAGVTITPTEQAAALKIYQEEYQESCHKFLDETVKKNLSDAVKLINLRKGELNREAIKGFCKQHNIDERNIRLAMDRVVKALPEQHEKCLLDPNTSVSFCDNMGIALSFIFADDVVDYIGLDVLNAINPETGEIPEQN